MSVRPGSTLLRVDSMAAGDEFGDSPDFGEVTGAAWKRRTPLGARAGRDTRGSTAMWDTAEQSTTIHLSHDMPCARCGHASHTYLACSDTCDCRPTALPGAAVDRFPALVSA